MLLVSSIGSSKLVSRAVIGDDGRLKFKEYKVGGKWYAVDDTCFQSWFNDHGQEYDYNAEACIVAYIKYAKCPVTFVT